jgi:hypothetical protein
MLASVRALRPACQQQPHLGLTSLLARCRHAGHIASSTACSSSNTSGSCKPCPWPAVPAAAPALPGLVALLPGIIPMAAAAAAASARGHLELGLCKLLLQPDHLLLHCLELRWAHAWLAQPCWTTAGALAVQLACILLCCLQLRTGAGQQCAQVVACRWCCRCCSRTQSGIGTRAHCSMVVLKKGLT